MDFLCKFCSKTCKSKMSWVQHELFCPKNENRKYKNGMTGKISWNSGKSKDTDERIAKSAQVISDKLKISSSFFTWNSSEDGRKSASKGGGYRANAGRSKKFYVQDSFGKQICLQSSYEYELSNVLNAHSIRWIRPSYLKYGEKKYFPDFYLVDYNIYLDTKNDYLAKIDAAKIAQVKLENEVDVRIVLKHEISTIPSLIRREA